MTSAADPRGVQDGARVRRRAVVETDEVSGLQTVRVPTLKRARFMPQEGFPILGKAEDAMNREAVEGGRTEVYAQLWEPLRVCQCERSDASKAASKAAGARRAVWDACCGAPCGPQACAECDAPAVVEKPRFWSCTECGWARKKTPQTAGATHHLNAWDLNSQYPGCLEGDLPWEGRWATEAEIGALDLDTFLFDEAARSKMYLIECDVTMNKAEWYPMLGEHTADPSQPKRDDGRKPTKLAWTNWDKTRITRYCPVLKAALKQGCRITKVHKMLVYGKRAYMASYVATLGRIKREQDELKAAGKPSTPRCARRPRTCSTASTARRCSACARPGEAGAQGGGAQAARAPTCSARPR